MHPRRALVTLAVILSGASTSTAQYPTRPTPETDFKLTVPKGTLQAWAAEYVGGKMPELQGELTKALCPTSTTAAGSALPDCKKSYYTLVFVARPEGGKAFIVRFLLHDPASEPYTLRLPGISELHELFLTVDFEDSVLQSTYVSTKNADPITDKLPDFIKGLDLKGLAGFVHFDTMLRSSGKAAGEETETIVGHLGKVLLPFKRSAINVKDYVTGWNSDEPDAAPLEATAGFENLPLQYVSLGAMAGVILSQPRGDTRTKTDGGKLAANPLTGTLAVALLNIHPSPYDPKSDGVSAAERFRFFGGLVLTPEFGVTGGVAIGIVRRLSLNIGYAVLRVDTTKSGDALGAPPADLHHPTRNGHAQLWLAGLAVSL